MITPAQSTKDFLTSLAVYPAGHGEALYAIHSLDNADKHTVLTPVLTFSYLTDVMLIEMPSGKRIPADPIYIGPVSAGSDAFFEVPEGYGVDADYRVYPTPDILFPEIDVFPNQPVISTLAAMQHKVERLIAEFERFVTERTVASR